MKTEKRPEKNSEPTSVRKTFSVGSVREAEWVWIKAESPFSMTRRGFLKWLVGSIAAGVAAVSGKGLKQAAKTATATVAKNSSEIYRSRRNAALVPESRG